MSILLIHRNNLVSKENNPTPVSQKQNEIEFTSYHVATYDRETKSSHDAVSCL
jgi:hypothetical protein